MHRGTIAGPSRWPAFGVCALGVLIWWLAYVAWILHLLASCTGESCLGPALKLGYYPLLLSLVGLGLSGVSLWKREKPKMLPVLSIAGHLVPSAYWAWWLIVRPPIPVQ